MNAIRNDIVWDYERRKNDISFNDIEKTLDTFGMYVTQICCDSFGNCPEITAYLDIQKFDSAFENSRPRPKKVIFSGPATTILWRDGTKTTVKCQDEDLWNGDFGIAMCYLKKLLGNKGNYNNIFREARDMVEFRPAKEKNLVYGEVESISDVIDQAKNIGSYMSKNIETVRQCMQDVANKLSEVGKEKK